jgi:hypothetical protein
MVGELYSTAGVEVVVIVLVPKMQHRAIIQKLRANRWRRNTGWVREVDVLVWSEGVFDGADADGCVGADGKVEALGVMGVVGVVLGPDAIIVDADLPGVIEKVGIVKYAFIVMDQGSV